jgi:pyruvate/2-oxoglutarate dehydrogenase complex dihydrolipoamide dehydrogenase (E3) component
LNTTATKETVDGMKPDSIIVAAGAVPLVLNIPGIHGPNVVLAQDILLGRREPAKSLAVLGGGLVGLETAVHLGWLGRKVRIFEKVDRLAPDVVSGVLPALLQLLDHYGVQKVLNADVVELSENGVVAETPEGRKSYPCDMIVLALGMNRENSLVTELKGSAAEVLVAGDAVKPRQALQATREGFEAGLRV